MAGSYASQTNPGMMLPTSYNWEVSQIYQIPGIPEELKLLLVRLYENVGNISLAVNLKDTGYYTNQEFLNSQVYFPNPSTTSSATNQQQFRQVFRTVVNFGALPNATTKTAFHNIQVNSGYSFTRIYGCATRVDINGFIPLPYSSPTLNKNVELFADNEKVTVISAIDYSAYTVCYIVLEYIKQ